MEFKERKLNKYVSSDKLAVYTRETKIKYQINTKLDLAMMFSFLYSHFILDLYACDN